MMSSDGSSSRLHTYAVRPPRRERVLQSLSAFSVFLRSCPNRYSDLISTIKSKLGPLEDCMNGRGRGVELEPSQDQVNHAVDQIPETSLQGASKTGGVRPSVAT